MIYILSSIGAGKPSLTKILAQDLGAPAYYKQVEKKWIDLPNVKKILCRWRKES